MAAKKFTKADIVDALYDKTGINRKDIHSVVDLFLEEVKSALIERYVIELRGFGTFAVKTRKARTNARNPRTGEIISTSPRGAVTFRSGRDLKHEVWTSTSSSIDENVVEKE